MEKFQKSALQLCAKLRIRQSVSWSNICTGSKAKQVCFHRWGARRGPGTARGSVSWAIVATATQGHRRTLKVMERKPRLHMHAGRLGGSRGWRKPRGGCQETEIWEQGQRG